MPSWKAATDDDDDVGSLRDNRINISLGCHYISFGEPASGDTIRFSITTSTAESVTNVSINLIIIEGYSDEFM
ncbi:hypothetical protein M8C21_032654 [Ambrosia artemisiifolia]|uniref:Uncharacterized protein n=1 Tax=Ambrosia artemisiifolia TaxID=4212 RepID=A0AAD5D7U6_AMBAR|nr:hypothetical protein M8C21_032654 [Ambrosia artemisiifolia]